MKNYKINRLDAPIGYVAIPPVATDKTMDVCTGCAFVKSKRCGMERNCTSGERKDKQMVIFIKR